MRPTASTPTVIDGSGKTLLPGFVDIHVHGGAGAEAMDASPDALRTMAQFYARHGVTAFLATTWTDTRPRIHAALEAIAASVGQQPDGATLIGAHVEGPYISEERPGAQSPVNIRRADRDEALAMLDLGVIRLMALAPEFPENHWLIRECVRRGITVSAAHTVRDLRRHAPRRRTGRHAGDPHLQRHDRAASPRAGDARRGADAAGDQRRTDRRQHPRPPGGDRRDLPLQRRGSRHPDH